MSLKKKEASGGLRVAANDPHLVSLGGGRLSTAVTIHYIPIGHTTIGSCPSCSVSLNGSGVRSLHCTVARNEQGVVTIVPEMEARVLIDGNKISAETNLTQGAMLTIGNSNYLRFNNPAEAQLIRSAMGSNERISMPQIDFTQDPNGSNRATPEEVLKNFNSILESQQKQNNDSTLNKLAKVEYININNFLSPKVFTADSVTVNTPAKDVLGPKYANFAKNLAENHKNDKNFCTKNNEMNLKTSNYVNIPASFIQNSPNSDPPPNNANEVLTKVNNNSGARNHYPHHSSSTYDRYPKPGSYGGLQLFPMNGVNSEINTYTIDTESSSSSIQHQYVHQTERDSTISAQDQERVDEILKICAEYDRQNQSSSSVQSSPIVQNRIKTNGSLPREKKSPFYDLGSQSTTHNSKTFFPDKPPPKLSSSTGYENVRLVGDRRVEIGGASNCSQKSTTSGYENVIVTGKYIPQSPRTKIRTTCASPKKDMHSSPLLTHPSAKQATEYAHLIHSFEEKLKLEMEAVRDREHQKAKEFFSTEPSKKRQNRNINNLTLNLNLSLDSTDKDYLEDLKRKRETVLKKIRKLKMQIADVQRQEDEVIREMDMEKALVTAELSTVSNNLIEMEKKYLNLQSKIHRLEAQRNANRVMQETQQAKLKQSIEMKSDQVSSIEKLVDDNSSNDVFRDDLNRTIQSLENDRKTFEDMEFQYLEEETDWLAYREDLHNDSKNLSKHIDDKRMQLLRLENQGVDNQNTACSDTKTLENNLLTLLTMLEKSREELQTIDKGIFDISGQQQSQSDSDDDGLLDYGKGHPLPTTNNNMMSQSLFGSTEILSSKPKEVDIMSRSVNENMFFNRIEMPSHVVGATSTPKKELQIFKGTELDDNCLLNGEITPKTLRRETMKDENDPLLKLKYNVESTPSSADEHKAKVNLNLSLGSDDFEVNPLDKRMPSQDDIDRICKVTLDAPISTKGASSKIIESIKEIERNRQLLLAQQGSHVIEHERQKMMELKKKSHDEARAQYLSSQISVTSNGVIESLESDSSDSKSGKFDDKRPNDAKQKLTNGDDDDEEIELQANGNEGGGGQPSSQQRHSNPELESHRVRPLSEVNSELNYDILKEKQFKSSNDIGPPPPSSSASDSNRLSENSDDGKRSSINSNDTTDEDRLVSGNKRNLPKHQRPLTRYLPIFSADLDLRQHIESAGHQITLCPHVVVDATSCRGYLHKLGATFHGWSRRWFVLDRQKSAFIYYSDKSERKPRGGAYFSTIDEVYLDHLNTSKSGRPHCTIIVKTKKRSYHLQAASDAAARIWIDAIITGAQGNIDY